MMVFDIISDHLKIENMKIFNFKTLIFFFDFIK